MDALQAYERAASIADALPDDKREEFAALLWDVIHFPASATISTGFRRWLRDTGYYRPRV